MRKVVIICGYTSGAVCMNIEVVYVTFRVTVWKGKQYFKFDKAQSSLSFRLMSA